MIAMFTSSERVTELASEQLSIPVDRFIEVFDRNSSERILDRHENLKDELVLSAP